MGNATNSIPIDGTTPENCTPVAQYDPLPTTESLFSDTDTAEGIESSGDDDVALFCGFELRRAPSSECPPLPGVDMMDFTSNLGLSKYLRDQDTTNNNDSSGTALHSSTPNDFEALFALLDEPLDGLTEWRPVEQSLNVLFLHPQEGPQVGAAVTAVTAPQVNSNLLVGESGAYEFFELQESIGAMIDAVTEFDPEIVQLVASNMIALPELNLGNDGGTDTSDALETGDTLS